MSDNVFGKPHTAVGMEPAPVEVTDLLFQGHNAVNGATFDAARLIVAALRDAHFAKAADAFGARIEAESQ